MPQYAKRQWKKTKLDKLKGKQDARSDSENSDEEVQSLRSCNVHCAWLWRRIRRHWTVHALRWCTSCLSECDHIHFNTQAGLSDEEEAGPREPIYNVDGIHEKLEDISWVEEAKWEEAQVVTGDDDAEVENVDDDLERELSFYNQVRTVCVMHAECACMRACSLRCLHMCPQAARPPGLQDTCVLLHACTPRLRLRHGSACTWLAVAISTCASHMYAHAIHMHIDAYGARPDSCEKGAAACIPAWGLACPCRYACCQGCVNALFQHLKRQDLRVCMHPACNPVLP